MKIKYENDFYFFFKFIFYILLKDIPVLPSL